jgi:hypothetical protein
MSHGKKGNRSPPTEAELGTLYGRIAFAFRWLPVPAEAFRNHPPTLYESPTHQGADDGPEPVPEAGGPDRM